MLCPICMGEDVDCTLPCGHSFCYTCLLRLDHKKCSICRQNYTSVDCLTQSAYKNSLINHPATKVLSFSGIITEYKPSSTVLMVMSPIHDDPIVSPMHDDSIEEAQIERDQQQQLRPRRVLFIYL